MTGLRSTCIEKPAGGPRFGFGFLSNNTTVAAPSFACFSRTVGGSLIAPCSDLPPISVTGSYDVLVLTRF